MEKQTTRKTDLGWNHGYLVNPKVTNDVTCKYCLIVSKGGIHRFKQHLADGYKNIKACTKCPAHMREEMIDHFDKKKKEREKMNLVYEYD
ncbi:hypothetical protein HRI_002472600 [Hibiscus trionum]|uniref:BED-type domain-containing protein n=1 Tax=Hibiscus trionum TaxID=183268 RepID=A0A9W7I2X7_HIBTR|nr:hypothetical protein HRI_002472600 [Hibiscus trionum]